MFVRVKRVSRGEKLHEYLQIVESYRKEGRVRQRIIGTIGRLDRLLAKGTLDSLIRSLSKFSRNLEVIEAKREGAIKAEWDREWGSWLIMRRLWKEVGLDKIIHSHLVGRKYAFDIEGAVFSTVLHRLIRPGSDVSCIRWLRDVYSEGVGELSLHHFYRTMAFLDENKDSIEESLFQRGRDLFDYKVDLVFFDTTSIYFEGEGPEGFASFGHSKDHRSDRRQIVVGVVMSRNGFPITCDFWPGNTPDIQTIKRIISSVKERFSLGRVIVVCDGGMVSRGSLEDLEDAKVEYIVATRMRKAKEVKEDVLSRAGRYHTVKENLRVKEVLIEGKRYISCFNPEEAKRERKVRIEIIKKLRHMLFTQGSKALIKNKGYRRLIKAEKGAFELDEEKLKEEERFDGKFVLYTNTDLSPGEVATSYKSLWQVEHAFSDLKNLLRVRPIYHRKPEHIRGHIFCNFLSLYLKVALQKKLYSKGVNLSWDDILSDIRAFRAIKLILNRKPYLLRTEFQRNGYSIFKAAGVKPPPVVQEIDEKKM